MSIVHWLGDTWVALADLVLPGTCAGCGDLDVDLHCGRLVGGLCPACAAALAGARPGRTRPDPEPAGLPPTVALAAYAGVLRTAILGYKERGRHDVAAALGDRLADVVLAGVGMAGGAGRSPVLLLPVPATAAAARRRYGDHMVGLAGRAAGSLRRRGAPAAVAYPLRARPRVDSAELGAADRAKAAGSAFVIRPRVARRVRAAADAGSALVLVDDVITTGATLAAAASRLAAAGLPVRLAAVVAATQRNRTGRRERTGVRPGSYSDRRESTAEVRSLGSRSD